MEALSLFPSSPVADRTTLIATEPEKVLKRSSCHWLLVIGEVRFATLEEARCREAARQLYRALSDGDPALSFDDRGYGYLLWSGNHDWAVRVQRSALALETRVFRDPTEFTTQLHEAVKVMLPWIDVNFFTRVGLRSVGYLSIDQAMSATRQVARIPEIKGVGITIEAHGVGTLGHYWLREYVDGVRPGTCTRDIDLYQSGVEETQLDCTLREFFQDSLELKPEQPQGSSLRDLRAPAAQHTDIAAFSEAFEADVPPTPGAGSPPPEVVGDAFSDNEFDRLNTQRIKLLARKYAQRDFSIEDKARLEILQTRISHLVQRVAEADIKRLEELADTSEKLLEEHLEDMKILEDYRDT